MDEFETLIFVFLSIVGFLLYKVFFKDKIQAAIAGASKTTAARRRTSHVIKDNYESIDDLKTDLRKAGLDVCGLVIGIDFTASNRESGAVSYGGDSLHKLHDNGDHNAYEQVIQIIMTTLLDDRKAIDGSTTGVALDDDGTVPIFGFGDARSRDRTVFEVTEGAGASSTQSALQAYRRTVSDPNLRLSGPTSIAPLVDRAVQLVKRTGTHHMLLIIADGQLSDPKRDMEAVVRASHYPLSITMVGVGDGPWDQMERLDDELPAGRQFDNFQFVDFEQCRRHRDPNVRKAMFARNALMELPEQYAAMQELGLLNKVRP